MQVVNLATNLKRRQWTVKLVSMMTPGPLVNQLKAMDIEVASLNMRRGVPDPRAMLRLATLLRRWRPRVLHSHMVHANLLGRLVRLIANVPVVISTVHSIDEGGRHREYAYRLSDFLADLTTNVSQSAVERYVRVGAVPQHKIRFMPNGLDTQVFRPNREARQAIRHELDLGNNFVWLAIGRFEVEKDYPIMLHAFVRLAAMQRDTILLIAGQGSLKDKAEALARDLAINTTVRFLGVRQDVPELMNAADAYVMSSAWEGMPIVLLEAAATGLPIVCTDVGGNREVVLNNSTGFLVPSREPQALAEAMQRMTLTSDDKRRQMGDAGRAHVATNYSLERVVDRWEALYKELMNRKKA